MARIIFVVIVAAAIAWLGFAMADLAFDSVNDAISATRDARYLQVAGPDATPKRIVLRGCEGWAEDTAANLRMVRFEAERVVYRCVGGGY